MTTRSSPIYIGTLNSKPLRFFRAPYTTPHLPWHSYDDLLRCIGVEQWVRSEVLTAIRTLCPDDIRTVPCGAELALITPHYAARWCIKNLTGTMRSRSKHDLKYRIAMIDAWYASMNNRFAAEVENLFLTAVRNTDRAEAGWAA